MKEALVTFTFRDDGIWSTYCSADATSENTADIVARGVALYVGVALNCMSEKEFRKLMDKLQKVMVRDLKKRRAAK